MAVRGLGLRAAELARAGAGLGTTILVVLAGCALIGVGVAGGGGAVTGIAAAAILVAVAWTCCDRLALSAVRARPVSEVEHPQLYLLVRELSMAARLPVPRLYLSPAGQPNALIAGRGSRTATLCCTEGLLRVLDEAELRGVLAQELGHVLGHDILASTVAAGLARVITSPAALARQLARRLARRARPGSGPVLPETLLMGVLGPVAALVVRLAVSVEREYRADAAGSQLTGDPVALASALRKIETVAAGLTVAPGAQLAPVAHLMIASPFRPEGLGRLFGVHPPMGDRLLRLESLAGYRR
jgi:heat shock protein HtpX